MNVFWEWADRTLQSDYMRKIAGLPLLSDQARQDVFGAVECAAKAVRQELKRLDYVEGNDELDAKDWSIAAVAINAYYKKLFDV